MKSAQSGQSTRLPKHKRISVYTWHINIHTHVTRLGLGSGNIRNMIYTRVRHTEIKTVWTACFAIHSNINTIYHILPDWGKNKQGNRDKYFWEKQNAHIWWIGSTAAPNHRVPITQHLHEMCFFFCSFCGLSGFPFPSRLSFGAHVCAELFASQRPNCAVPP